MTLPSGLFSTSAAAEIYGFPGLYLESAPDDLFETPNPDFN